MKTLLCTLTLAFFCLLLAPQQAQAQYYCSYGIAYGTSYTWQSGTSVYGYSSTQLDYCAGLYYDPATWGRFSEGSWASENVRMLADVYTEGYADWVPAEIYFSYGYPRNNEYYNTDTRHYVLEYYQQYACFYGCGYYWYDPWGWGFAEGGYGGPSYYGYGGAGYWSMRRRRLGDTWHTIQYRAPDTCDPGQNFSETSGGCQTPTPTPPSTPTPTPTPAVTVDEVGFKGDFPVLKFATDQAIDPDDMTPTWIRGSNWNGDNMVAYKKSTKPTVFAAINVSQASSSYPTASLRVKHGSTVLATVSGVNVGSNGKVKVDNISFTGDLPDSSKVKQSKYTFAWEISFDGSSWAPLNSSGEHEVHWLYDTPTSIPASASTPAVGPEFTTPTNPPLSFSGLYDEALRHATAKTGEGLTDVEQIIAAINTGVANDIFYSPSTSSPHRHPLSVYIDGMNMQQCSDNVALLRGLLRSIGIHNTTVNFFWGGDKNSPDKVSHWFIPPGGSPVVRPGFPTGETVTAQFPRPAHDGAPDLPYFSFHSTLRSASGKSYDPSYGIVEDEVSVIAALDSSGNCIRGTAANDWRVKDTKNYTHGRFFGYACGTTASAPRSAMVVSQSVPAYMDAGYLYNVSVTLRNNGSETWTQADGYRLGSQSPQDNYTWGMNRVDMPTSVPPGGEVTFNFYASAPSYAGTYDFQWRMIQDGVEWFGDATPNIPIEVYATNFCDVWQEQDCWNRGGSWDSNFCQCYGGWYY